MSLDAEIDAIVAEMDRELTEAPVAQRRVHGEAGTRADWKRRARHVPDCVAKLLNTIDLLILREQALDRMEGDLFGWTDRRDGVRSLDAATVRTAWNHAITGSHRASNMAVVRHAVDDTKHVAQVQKLEGNTCASTLPAWQANPKVRAGVLYTRDVSRGTPTFGVRSYPEATPIEIFVLVVRLWQERSGKTRPRVWDPTGGSGTGHDVITTVFGGRVISTDIALDNGKTSCGDIRNAGQLARHGGSVPAFQTGPEKVIKHPDIVFIHPPSPGWPACAWIYGREGQRSANDLGMLLERDQYVSAIAQAIKVAADRLTNDGLISVVVPQYLRLHQEIVADAGVADALLDQVSGFCALIERHAVVDEAPVRQASLASTRGPVEHLILSKKVRS